MFCEKCGTPAVDGAKFCEGCGAALSAPEAATESMPVGAAPVEDGPMDGGMGAVPDYTPNHIPGSFNADQSAKNNAVKIIIALAVAAVVAILAIVGIAKAVGGGPEKPVANVIKAINKQDAELLVKAVLPQPVQKALKQNKEFKEYMFEDYEEAFEEFEDMLEEGKVSYEILDKERLDEGELESHESYLESRLDSLEDSAENKDIKVNFDDVKVQDGYELTVKLKWKEDGENESEKESVRVYKVNGKWYTTILG